MHNCLKYFTLAAILAVTIVACGGGSGPAPANVPPSEPVVPTYSVGGNVSGLDTGGSLVLRNNSGNSQIVSQNGSFVFASALGSGATYAVEIVTHPSGQTCTLTSGAGTIQSSNVVNIGVACKPLAVTIVEYGAPVTTFAGIPGDPGANDGDRSIATLGCPLGLALDGNGGFYVADSLAQTVRRISANGEVTTLAGVPLSAYDYELPKGADGRGAKATFGRPAGLTADQNGNVYVADSDENTIRKITPDGTTTTFAGKYPNGTLMTNRATFYTPIGIASDRAGNVYVADSGSHVIFKLTPDGFSTVIGGTSSVPGSSDGTGASALFNQPLGLAVDSAGNVYVSDSGNNVIRKIAVDGVVSTIAGAAGIAGAADGVGAASRFDLPSGIAVDAAGTLYVVDTRNQLIRQISRSGVVTTLAGAVGTPGSSDGYGASAYFYDPYGIAVDGHGTVYVADCGNSTVRKIVPNGNGPTTVEILPPAIYPELGVVTTLVKGYNGTGYSAIVLDNAGNIYDSGGSTALRKVSPDGTATILAGAVGVAGYVNATGTAARFEYMGAMGIDSMGNIYVSNYDNLRKISAAGVVTTAVVAAPFNFGPMAIDAVGNIYTSDPSDNVVRKLTPSGVSTIVAGYAGYDPNILTFDSVGTTARFQTPQGIVIDPTGHVYVADSRNKTIRKISPAGVVTTIAGMAGVSGSTDGIGGAARFHAPTSLALDQQGNLYVSDNFTIRKITPERLVTIVAGTAGQSGSADGVGTAARFEKIGGIAVNANGVIYVADNGAIRRIIQR